MCVITLVQNCANKLQRAVIYISTDQSFVRGAHCKQVRSSWSDPIAARRLDSQQHLQCMTRTPDPGVPLIHNKTLCDRGRCLSSPVAKLYGTFGTIQVNGQTHSLRFVSIYRGRHKNMKILEFYLLSHTDVRMYGRIILKGQTTLIRYRLRIFRLKIWI